MLVAWMGPAAQFAGRLTSRLAWQAVVSFVALALVGVGVGECLCPMRLAPAAQGCCRCCSRGGPSAATATGMNVRSRSCGMPDSETSLVEGLWRLDGPPALVVDIGERHDGWKRVPAAPLVEPPPLIPSSSHPILRI